MIHPIIFTCEKTPTTVSAFLPYSFLFFWVNFLYWKYFAMYDSFQTIRFIIFYNNPFPVLIRIIHI